MQRYRNQRYKVTNKVYPACTRDILITCTNECLRGSVIEFTGTIEAGTVLGKAWNVLCIVSLSLLFVYVPTTLVWSTLVSAGRVRIPRRDLLVTRSRRGIASRINTTKCFLTNQLAEYAAWRRYRGPLWQCRPVTEVKQFKNRRFNNFQRKTLD